MLIKIIFITIDILAVITLYFISKAAGRINRQYGWWLKYTLIAGMTAVFSNIVIALAKSASFAYYPFALYYASIDWILYFLVGFCISYTEHHRELEKLKYPAAVIFGLDSLSMLLNPFFEHEFHVYAITDISGEIFYQTHPLFINYIHLTLDYIAVMIAFGFMINRIRKSYSFYRTKYVLILSVLILVVILNFLYILVAIPLDASVIFYALAGTLIYFSIQRLVPQSLMNSSIGRAVDDMSEGLILFDIQNNCIYANAFSKQHFDIDPSDYDLDREPVATIIHSLSEKGSRFGELPYSITRHDSEGEHTAHYMIRYNALTDTRGRMIGSYFLFEDTTDQVHYLEEIRSARDAADSASKAKSSFLASMSHEIRTPLNSVLGMNEMILRSTDDPTLREYAENIRQSGDTLLGLINDILDFSKIEANKMDVTVAEYDPHELIRKCLNNFEQMADAKDLYIRSSCDESMPRRLIGDNKLILQIITNIISNAIKYTREGGISLHMTGHTSSEDGYDLEISVSDTGIGIRKEDIAYLFDEFRRVNEKENATIQGTGLGLAITKHLIDLMNGHISVDSTPGKGSTFTVVISQTVADREPIGVFRQHIEKPVEKYKEAFRAPDAHILVVDDARMNLKVVQALLRKTQVLIDTAASGNEAIDMCYENRYDLILLDHRMPEPDGIQTFHAIRSDGRNMDTPVIMLTANVVAGAEEEYKRIGFSDYLSKPIHGDELEAMIRKHLDDEKIL